VIQVILKPIRFPVRLLSGIITMLLLLCDHGSAQPDWQGRRDGMLRAVAEDVQRNAHVLGRPALSAPVARAMATVPRHLFIPEKLWSQAYANHPLPIGQGQTISQPTIVALMTDLLGCAEGDTVLEVGTGSGYQAAVLAEVVSMVHTVEIVPQLARTAKTRLNELGYDNVVAYEGDGYMGLPDLAPFDGIMVTAAAEQVPGPLLEQLKPGARLVIPVGPAAYTQWLTVWVRDEDGLFHEEKKLPVRFVPMTGKGQQED
jgi:protein-L-isoaspartate(D-aspartate) O-methyltransferase